MNVSRAGEIKKVDQNEFLIVGKRGRQSIKQAMKRMCFEDR